MRFITPILILFAFSGCFFSDPDYENPVSNVNADTLNGSWQSGFIAGDAAGASYYRLTWKFDKTIVSDANAIRSELTIDHYRDSAGLTPVFTQIISYDTYLYGELQAYTMYARRALNVVASSSYTIHEDILFNSIKSSIFTPAYVEKEKPISGILNTESSLVTTVYVTNSRRRGITADYDMDLFSVKNGGLYLGSSTGTKDAKGYPLEMIREWSLKLITQ
jgi:hypothetical protein